MADLQPGICIERMVIRKNAVSLYDQPFHRGVNIIRGGHSVGKSTILDLIFYVLGGEIKRESWVYPANVCDEVFLQAEINGKVFCLRRQISLEKIESVGIYVGTYDEAARHMEGWSYYGPRRSESKRSFSQQIFEMLGWGDGAKTDEYANLTMHQILRMLYVDQETSDFKILRTEQANADSESTRLAIAEFLLGLDDLEAHSLRQRLIVCDRAFHIAYDRLMAIYKVVGKDSEYIESELLKEVADIYDQIRVLNEQRRSAAISPEPGAEVVNAQVERQRTEVMEKTSSVAAEIELIGERLGLISSEIADCNAFSRSLDERKKALISSKATFEAIGKVDFKFCPSCNAEIANNTDDNMCSLCKCDTGLEGASSAYLERLNELFFQEKNNKKAIEENAKEYARLEAELFILQQTYSALRAELGRVASSFSFREEEVARVSREIGFAESQIQNLKEKLKIVQEMDQLRAEKERLNMEIQEITERLQRIEANREGRRAKIYGAIANSVCEILHADGNYEPVFEKASPDEVEIDFARDRWLLDGRIKFSGSSNFIKKNALHVACLLTALGDASCRYPRFLILDGVENGGMTPERSQPFQRKIVEMLRPYHPDFQIIFVTAMIDESLNNDDFGVGPYYPKGTHILDLANAGLDI